MIILTFLKLASFWFGFWFLIVSKKIVKMRGGTWGVWDLVRRGDVVEWDLVRRGEVVEWDLPALLNFSTWSNNPFSLFSMFCNFSL